MDRNYNEDTEEEESEEDEEEEDSEEEDSEDEEQRDTGHSCVSFCIFPLFSIACLSETITVAGFFELVVFPLI